VFSLQKYKLNAQETNYLALTNRLQEGYVSSRLQELCSYYSNRISYEEVALLELICKQKLKKLIASP